MQKVMIYESSFSDFLIMLDSGQEIKTLSNAEWSDIIKAKSIEGVSNERIQFSLLKGIPFDMYSHSIFLCWFFYQKYDWVPQC